MSFSGTTIHERLLRVRRAFWLLIGVALLSPASGCTAFQSISSQDWHEGKWFQFDQEQPVNNVLAIWDKSVRVAQDTRNAGASLPGLVSILLVPRP